MKPYLFFIFIIVASWVHAEEPLRFKYFSIPREVCQCQSTEIDSFQKVILASAEDLVQQRKRIKPKREKEEAFPRTLGELSKTMATERNIIRKAANEEYRRKIEPLYFRLSKSKNSEKPKLTSKIEKEQKNFCRKYSRKQNKLIQKQIGQLLSLRQWMDQLIQSKSGILPDEKLLTISDFDLYLMYLEVVSKAYDYRIQPSERAKESGF